VIPDLVDADLLNEHIARYRFANHIAAALPGKPSVLDAGCGSGYGTGELFNAASIVAADISADAIRHARRQYARTGVCFLQASCEAMPFRDGAFDLVVAFEVIEHLERWQDLLSEASRVLTQGGILLVSTPNREYYAESRGASGPNPFHVHEFDYEEFRQALNAVFPHVRIWSQNHAGAIVFAPQGETPAGATLDAPATRDTAHANFYVAACSRAPLSTGDIFAWLPTSANVLRERERHIAKLSGELAQKDAWLRQSVEAHGDLQKKHEELTAELHRQNLWADELNREVVSRNARIAELQGEVSTRLEWIADLEAQIKGAATEIERLEAEGEEQKQTARSRIDQLEATVTERTLWAQQLDTEIAAHREELRRIASTKWVQAGMKLGLGPTVNHGQ